MEKVREGMDIENLRSILRDYYGRHLKSKSDLSQNACCTGETQKRYKQILDLLPADVKEKHYGCGCPVPQDDLKGLTALDLGWADRFCVWHRYDGGAVEHSQSRDSLRHGSLSV